MIFSGTASCSRGFPIDLPLKQKKVYQNMFFKRIYEEPFRMRKALFRTILYKGSTNNHVKGFYIAPKRVVTIAEPFIGATTTFFNVYQNNRTGFFKYKFHLEPYEHGSLLNLQQRFHYGYKPKNPHEPLLFSVASFLSVQRQTPRRVDHRQTAQSLHPSIVLYCVCVFLCVYVNQTV